MIDRDRARCPLHRFSRAGRLVQRLSVHLYRGIHRRDLPPLAEEMRQDGCHRRGIHGGGNRRLLQNLPGDITRIGAAAQPEKRGVGFVRAQLHVHRLGCRADKNRQHAGCHRVQRAGVPDAPCAADAAQLCVYIKRCKALWLIDDDYSLHKAFSTSVRSAVLALSRLPSSSQPAACRCPPPPRWAQMAAASTRGVVRTLTL